MKNYIDDFKPSMERGIQLATSLGASAAQISFSSGEATSIDIENSKLKYATASQRQSYSISVVLEGKRGSTCGNQPENLENLVRRAIELARNGAASHYNTLPKPAESYRDIKSYDPAIEEKLTRDTLIQDCWKLVHAINDMEPNLTVEAGAGTSVGQCITINSAGLVDEYKVSSWDIGAGLQKTAGTDMLELYAGRSWQQLNHFYDLDYIQDQLATDLRRAAKTDALKDGKYPLVIPPLFLNRFLTPLFKAINGRNVFRGISPLKDQLGRQLFDQNLNLLDDPFIDYDAHSEKMDDEGIPAQQLNLVKDGVIPQFLYDYDTACMAKTAPTGNAGSAPYHPLLIPGQDHSQRLFDSLPQAVFIKRLLGFGQGNFMNGDFSANVELGFVMRNGEITGRLKNAMISGNLFEMLNQPIMVSADTHPVCRQPYLIFPQVNLFSRS